MKLLILSRYPRAGASSRVRMLQYRSALEAAGFDIEVQPLFSDAYLERLYEGRSVAAAAASSLARRIRRLLTKRDADVVWLEKEGLPWLPWVLERGLLPRSSRLISDYDDAVHHRYDSHSNALVRRTLGRKIGQVMAHSTVVIAGNRYLADHADSAGARHVEIVPTVVDTDAYRPGEPRSDESPVIGWLGTVSTWREYVVPNLGSLTRAAQELGVRFVAVGVTGRPLEKDGVEHVAWSEDKEVELIQGMDIGIMPLTDSPWARGKCGYKLIQYMACGLPVVASPVGVNTEIVEHGVNGFLAETDNEWRDALGELCRYPELRRRMGEAGRQKVIRDYSLARWAPKVVEIMRVVAVKGELT